MSGSLPCFLHISASCDVGPLRITLLIFLCRSINTLIPSNLMTLSLGCPHCGGREVTLWGKASGVPRYRCKSCGRTFNALTKTPLAHLRKKDKWLEQAGALIDGASVSKAAERCDVAYTTAFRWRHRFLEALSLDKPKNLSGIVEGDETFILESFKGKRSGIPRASRRRGGKAAKRGL